MMPKIPFFYETLLHKETRYRILSEPLDLLGSNTMNMALALQLLFLEATIVRTNLALAYLARARKDARYAAAP